MKEVKFLAGALGVVAGLVAQTVFGAGFGIYEGSARGNALATEVTADPASPSVLYNNAAGMTELEGSQVEVGVTAIKPSLTVVTETPAGATKTDTEDNLFMVPSAYVTHQISDKMWAGLGVFSRYGLGVEYPDDWPGRYNVQEVNIQSLDINPSIAYKVLDNLSLAAGVRAEWFDLELYRAIPTGAPFLEPDLQMKLAGDSWGVGYNLGAYYEANEWLSLGLAYDSRIMQEVEGDYSVTHPAGMKIGQGAGSGEITTPDIIRMGASIKATEKLTVNAGVVYTLWSSYDELAINFDPPLLDRIPASVTEKSWNDVFRYQLGAEYALDETWALRAGYIYDKTPDPDLTMDYLVPANDRNLFSVGVGYKQGDFFCDLAYTYLMIEDRDVVTSPERALNEGLLPGEYKDGDTHLFGISVGYKL